MSAGRPRNPNTPTRMGVCPVHGEVEFRQHKTGHRDHDQSQKYRWRCPSCHSKANGDRQKAQA